LYVERGSLWWVEADEKFLIMYDVIQPESEMSCDWVYIDAYIKRMLKQWPDLKVIGKLPPIVYN
jgi:hypothetical protein